MFTLFYTASSYLVGKSTHFRQIISFIILQFSLDKIPIIAERTAVGWFCRFARYLLHGWQHDSRTGQWLVVTNPSTDRLFSLLLLSALMGIGYHSAMGYHNNQCIHRKQSRLEFCYICTLSIHAKGFPVISLAMKE